MLFLNHERFTFQFAYSTAVVFPFTRSKYKPQHIALASIFDAVSSPTLLTLEQHGSGTHSEPDYKRGGCG